MNEGASSPARRRTGPARSLTRAQVVDAALEVMSNQGLDAVSFRTIAMRLGVDPKALYTYVSDKNDLLAAMFDVVMTQLDLPSVDDPRSPEDRIVGLLSSLRRALVANADQVRLTRPLDVPGVNPAGLERMAQALLELGLDKGAAVRIFQRLIQYTLGSAMYGAQRSAHPPVEVQEAPMFDPTQYPFAMALAEGGPFVEDDDDFAAAIRVMLVQRVGETT